MSAEGARGAAGAAKRTSGAAAKGGGRECPEAPLRVNRAEALRYLGYAGQELDGSLAERFEALARACESELRPRWTWAAFPVDGGRSRWGADGGPMPEGRRPAEGASASKGARCAEDAPVPEDAHRASGIPCVALSGTSLSLEGHAIARHLRGARQAALLACTLGAESERRLRLLSALSATDALLYGAAASSLAEGAADAAERAVAAWAAENNLRCGARFSPGYGDLPLSVQPALLAALDAHRRIGLAATCDNLLVPAKSVTAVIGLFDASVTPPDARDRCGACPRYDDCPLRKEGATCHGR